MKQTKNTNPVIRKKYGLIQVPAEVLDEMKAYCDKHGFKIGRLTANIILKYIRNTK